jgi:toxin-antitoxin system PIN domain toxin
VILVDANILIYAIDQDSPHHARARRWLEETLSGDTWVGLPWIVILAFIRLTTRAGVVRNPLPPDQALAFVDSWLRQPYVAAVGPGERHWPILSNLLRASGTAGNLTSDAHVAALALEHGGTVVSADSDFGRFSGIIHFNPLGD